MGDSIPLHNEEELSWDENDSEWDGTEERREVTKREKEENIHKKKGTGI